MSVERVRHLVGIGVDATAELADAAAPDVLRLENLDTDLRPPDGALAISRDEVDADSANSYLPFFGANELRMAATEHVAGLSGVQYDWQRQCIITAGGCAGILNTLLALLNPGDEVVMTDPIYVGLINRVRLAGGIPVFVPFHAANGAWRLDLDALRRAITKRTRVFLMMSPSMPSGAVLNRSEWEAIAKACIDADAWMIYNAAMERILYDGAAHNHGGYGIQGTTNDRLARGLDCRAGRDDARHRPRVHFECGVPGGNRATCGGGSVARWRSVVSSGRCGMASAARLRS